MSGEMRVFDDAETLARDTTAWLRNRAWASPGRFAICCSGGSTPKRLYGLMAHTDMPWDRVHWFWGDERFVPHDHPNSNYGMTRNALLAHVPVPPQNVHAVPFDECTVEQAADRYERTLHDYYGALTLDPARPLFDVVLLGIGDDGHTASLFPGQPTLDVTQRWAAAVIGVKTEDRITLTYPALDCARDVVFLAVGATKRAVVKCAREGDSALPAARVKPVGSLYWFVDRTAAPA